MFYFAGWKWGRECTPQSSHSQVHMPGRVARIEGRHCFAEPQWLRGIYPEKYGPWILSRVIVIGNKVVFGSSLFGRESETTNISLNLIWKPRRCVHPPLGKYAKVMIPIHFSHISGSDFRGKISEWRILRLLGQLSIHASHPCINILKYSHVLFHILHFQLSTATYHMYTYVYIYNMWW